MIAFFDIFDYPLTLNEIRLSLSVKGELPELMEALEELIKSPLPPFVKRGDGFYFLSGRSAIAAERRRRYNFTDRKFKRALLIAGIFKFIPWIKMIAVSNLIGAHNLKDSSDIDFFIVTEDKKIWLTRFFCAGLAKFLGLRPQADNSRDKICLSFYASEKAMELNGLRLKNPPTPLLEGGQIQSPSPPLSEGRADIYFIHWLAGLTPLYDVDNTYQKLIKANQWLYDSLPNWSANAFTAAGKQPKFWPRRRDAGGPLPRFYRDVVDLFFGGLEPQFKKLQLKLLPPQLKNLMNQDSRVVINDQIIKLHANDRRSEYREKYLEKIKKLSLRA